MTLTLELPPDVETALASIPSLDLRIALYLRHEAQLETVRRNRHSAEARAIAERAMIQASKDQAVGFDWAASFGTLKQQHQAIADKL